MEISARGRNNDLINDFMISSGLIRWHMSIAQYYQGHFVCHLTPSAFYEFETSRK